MDRLALSFCIVTCLLCTQSVDVGAQGIGVTLGLQGNNLPEPPLIVEHLKYYKITKIRIYEPNPALLQALKDSEIEVVMGTLNNDLQKLATDPAFATQWVQNNVVAYTPAVKFRYITAGNEVIPGPDGQHVVGAVQNINNALKAAQLNIPVSTVVGFNVLGTVPPNSPPSNAAFSKESLDIMSNIVKFLSDNQYPLLANLYPYYAFAADPNNIKEDYALGNKNAPTLNDGALNYDNMFEAMIDAIYAALEKAGGQNVKVVVSETGWPSAGGAFAAASEARSYNDNVMHRLATAKGRGTPRRPEIPVEAYIFSLFNENLHPPGIKQNFGLFDPANRLPVYVAYFPTIN